MEEAAPASFDDLPPALVLAVFQCLPRLVDRVRCALVSRSCAALLREPAFWSDLDFEGAQPDHLSDALVLSLARKSRGNLRSLDVTAREALHRITMSHGSRPLLSALASEGLTRRLERVCVNLWLFDPKRGEQIRLECPALRYAGFTVPCGWADAFATLEALSCPRVGAVDLFQQQPARQFPVRGTAAALREAFTLFASAAAEALSRTAVDSLSLKFDFHVEKPSSPAPRIAPAPARDEEQTAAEAEAEAAAAAKAQAAAAALGRALADPLRGPISIRGRGTETDETAASSSSSSSSSSAGTLHAPSPFAFSSAGGIPGFVEMCGFLTARSRLRDLSLNGTTWAQARPAAALAAALGRREGCGVRSLSFMGGVVSDCAHLVFAALGKNASVTSLTLSQCALAPGAAVALATALRRNRALRELRLRGVRFDGAGGSNDAGVGGGCLPSLLFALGREEQQQASGGRDGDAVGAGAEASASFRFGPPLRLLEISEVRFSSIAAEVLGAAIRCGAPLERFALSGTAAAGQAAAVEVAAALVALAPGGEATLRHLELRGCSVGDAGAEALARALRHPACPLESLSLRGCRLGDKGGLALANALRANPAPRLRELDLGENGALGPEAARAVEAAVAAARGADERVMGNRLQAR